MNFAIMLFIQQYVRNIFVHSVKWISLMFVVAAASLVSLVPFLMIQTLDNSVKLKTATSPPESLVDIEFCAEKCRYIPEMCTSNMYRDHLQLPAPECLKYSTTVEDDIYWTSLKTKDPVLNNERNQKTVNLVSWAAARAMERQHQSSKFQCYKIPTSNTAPMMFPEEL